MVVATPQIPTIVGAWSTGILTFRSTTTITLRPPCTDAGQLMFMRLTSAGATTSSSVGGAPLPSGFTLMSGLLNSTRAQPNMNLYVWRKVSTAADVGATLSYTYTGTNDISVEFSIIAMTGVNTAHRAATFASQGATVATTISIPQTAGGVSGDITLNVFGVARVNTATGYLNFNANEVDTTINQVGYSTATATPPSYYTPTGVFALSTGTPGPRSFSVNATTYRVAGQIILSPAYGASGKGGSLKGEGQLSSRGYKSFVRLRSSYTNSATVNGSVSLVLPSSIGDGDLLVAAIVINGSTTGPIPTLSAIPAGWTFYSDTPNVNGTNLGHRLLIFTRLGNSTLTGTSVATFTGASNMTMCYVVMSIAGAGAVPRSSSIASNGTTAGPWTVAAAPTQYLDRVLTFAALEVTTVNTVITAVSATAPAVTWADRKSAIASVFNNSLSVFTDTPGPQTITATPTGTRAITGQLVLYAAETFVRKHPGGPVTGYVRLKVTRGRKSLSGRGGQITGYASMRGGTGRRGITGGIGGRINGYGKITAIHGTIVAGVRPMYRASAIATADNAASVTLTIPASTRVGDSLLLEVALSSSTAQVIAPDGWQVMQDNTTVVFGVVHAIYSRTATYLDPGLSFVVQSDSTAGISIAAVLGVYKSAMVVDQQVTDQGTGTLSLKFGPTGDYDAGFTRVAIGTARPTLTGERLLFSSSANGDTTVAKTTLRAQASPGSDTQGVYLGDYDAATALRGQLSSVTPIRARTDVIELVAVAHHEGTFYAAGRITVRSGVKVDPVGDSAKLRGKINGYAKISVPAEQGHGVHTPGLPLVFFSPRDVRAFWVVEIHPGPGYKYDSYRGSRIQGVGSLSAQGLGKHNTEPPDGTVGRQQIRAYGDVRQRNKRPHRFGTVDGFVAEASLHGEGIRTWMHPGSTIRGYAVLAGLAGQGRVNLLIAEGLFVSEVGRGAHNGAGTPVIGRPLKPQLGGTAGGRIDVQRGVKVSTVDERYTQIRGYAVLAALAGDPGPPRIIAFEHPGGTIVGEAIISAEDLGPRRPEEITVEITPGYPSITQDIPTAVEDFLMRALPGNQIVVTRLVPGETYTSNVVYGLSMRPTYIAQVDRSDRVYVQPPGGAL
ncbi:MAG: hypothetical protein ABWY93_18875 [Mycobacterium sp.]